MPYYSIDRSVITTWSVKTVNNGLPNSSIIKLSFVIQLIGGSNFLGIQKKNKILNFLDGARKILFNLCLVTNNVP